MKSKIKTITLLTLLTTFTLYIINKTLYSLSTLKGILYTKENNYYEWRFGKIRYTKKGNGAPILLLHDLTSGSSSYEFHKIIDDLSKTNQVYAIDLLGYGLSDKTNITYTNFLYVQLITDFIKNIIGEKANVITSGDSSSIAIMACHNDPEIINKLIFINPQNIASANLIPSKRTKLLKLLIECPIIGTFVYNLMANKTNFASKFKQDLFYNKEMIEQEYIDAYNEAAHIKDYKSKFAISSYLGKYINLNITHALNKIDYSMFIIAGEEKDNNETIIDNYLCYNSAIEVSYIEETKQLPHLERPKEVLSYIKMYFDS